MILKLGLVFLGFGIGDFNPQYLILKTPILNSKSLIGNVITIIITLSFFVVVIFIVIIMANVIAIVIVIVIVIIIVIVIVIVIVINSIISIPIKISTLSSLVDITSLIKSSTP